LLVCGTPQLQQTVSKLLHSRQGVPIPALFGIGSRD
jgi:hypothetical protein